MTFFIQMLLSGVSIGAVYSLVALGFVIIYKASGIFNLALGEMLVLGAGMAWVFFEPLGLPVWLGILLTLIFAAALGLFLERTSIRPMIGQPLFTAVMVTIALSIILRGFALMGWPSAGYAYPEFIPRRALEWGDILLSEQLLWTFFIALLAVLGFTLFFRYTKNGLAMRAVAEDHQVAQSAGISVKGILSLTWIVGGLLCAVAGILLGSITGVSIELTSIGLKVLPVVLLGGLDSIPGAVIGGLIVGVLETLSQGYLDPLVSRGTIIGAGLKDVVPFMVMIVVLIFRPYGLFGLKRIERI